MTQELQYNLQPIWSAELELYQKFVYICEKYSLRYYAAFGTALGAIRHQGFIPWDDDLDFEMPRPDYEKFLKVAEQELPCNLMLKTWNNTPNYGLRFAEIFEKDQNIISKVRNSSHLDVKNIWIDIFPIDGLPNNTIVLFWWKIRLSLVKAMSYSSQTHKDKVSNSLKWRWLVGRFSNIFTCSPKNMSFYRIWQEKLETAFSYEQALKVGNLSSPYGKRSWFLDKNIYGEGKIVPFETTTIRVPSLYDTYLSALYRDWRQLPPQEYQKPPHLVLVNHTSLH